MFSPQAVTYLFTLHMDPVSLKPPFPLTKLNETGTHMEICCLSALLSAGMNLATFYLSSYLLMITDMAVL